VGPSAPARRENIASARGVSMLTEQNSGVTGRTSTVSRRNSKIRALAALWESARYSTGVDTVMG
jgi:hypothetical protein